MHARAVSRASPGRRAGTSSCQGESARQAGSPGVCLPGGLSLALSSRCAAEVRWPRRLPPGAGRQPPGSPPARGLRRSGAWSALRRGLEQRAGSAQRQARPTPVMARSGQRERFYFYMRAVGGRATGAEEVAGECFGDGDPQRRLGTKAATRLLPRLVSRACPQLPVSRSPFRVSGCRAPLLGGRAHNLKAAVGGAHAGLSGRGRSTTPPPPRARGAGCSRRARALLGGCPALGEAEAAGLHRLWRPACSASSLHPGICQMGSGESALP